MVAVIHRLSNRVFGLTYRIVRDREQAKDITQDVFVKVLQEAGRIRDRDRIEPYILKSAYNAALNARRDTSRQQAKAELIGEHLSPGEPSRPDQHLENAETRSRLYRALEQLAVRQKEALALRFFAEMSVTEIARAMKISEGSVKTHISRGMHNLKERLAAGSAKEI
ncbi:MAG: sigma-70 family RNA polymerase sigma factor [candidate division Zixibacteria bacterium]|nr:sigma-70 family RNA polymerase sigma factor [candidate division Zixibacteria bacterium]